ncbi:MAG: FHA domain-containing protein [Planctomycetes bacterium]|nr:FHA domain-containing protein [Planctomycetota bacterium]
MAEIVVIENGKETRLEIGSTPITIGREPSNTVALKDQRCSRKHVKVERVGAEFVITDLKSSNGTLHNGQRITQKTLADGDRFAIGSAQIVFENPAPPAPAQEEDLPEVAAGAATIVEPGDDPTAGEPMHLTFAESPGNRPPAPPAAAGAKKKGAPRRPPKTPNDSYKWDTDDPDLAIPADEEGADEGGGAPIDFGVPVDGSAGQGGGGEVPTGPLDPRMVFLTGAQKNDSTELVGRDAWFIGSDGNTDIIVEDKMVAPIHAAVRADPDGTFHISDSGSTTGTYVNGKFIVSDTPLNHGDVIRIGETAMKFLLYGDKKRRRREETERMAQTKGRKGFVGKFFKG